MAPPLTEPALADQAIENAETATVLPASGTRPLTQQLAAAAKTWAAGQHQLIVLAAEFADSIEWVLAGSPTAAHWLAEAADVETCTAREWIRIGRKLADLTHIAEAYANAEISYSKVRTLTRYATKDNEQALLDIAKDVPASELGRAIAYWLNENNDPDDMEAMQHQMRGVKWRTEADGMTLFSLRLQPLLAGALIAFLTTVVMRSKPGRDPRTGEWPTLSQQYADALEALLTDRAGSIDTEIVIHVRGDGNTLDDGTPINQSAVENIAPGAFIRALIHDIDGNPIDASNRRRHPTTRQKRVVKERDRHCIDCGRTELLEYDHVPNYEQTRHTITKQLRIRCAPCHDARHSQD